ncbi:MAG: transcription termination factor NusA [Coriobacteriia bacterium]|nr:transcription termination factor NusA [Coriobacteriia bacterium]
MSSELMEALKQLAREKNIDEFEMLDRLEHTLAQTYRKTLDLENEARVEIDRDTGRIRVFELVPVGGTEEEPVFEERDITPSDISRFAALAAKQVITQAIREAEREQIFQEYADRIGDSITGTVQQSDSRYTLIKIREGVEALLPPTEQPPNERYDHNMRLKALIIDVRKSSGNEPSIVVSRTHPNLLKRLFELEVPEIYDGIVEIKSVAREPGIRSKVAVASREPGLDPVGACVGPKGSRVRMVVAELKGERIDVIPWSDDPATFVGNALSPAKVSTVLIDEDTHTATVIVPDDQLSLAIGKEGQNARLAAKLTGWRIDIKSMSQALESGIAVSAGSGHAAGEPIDGRCAHVSNEGIRCRNQALPGSRFCRIHAGEDMS